MNLSRLPVLFTAVLVLAACAGAGSSGTPSAASTLPLPTGAATSPATSGSDIDRAFIDMMVPHHQSAVEMARVALERAEHEELIGLAEEVIAAQETEIAQMRQWRLAWFGSDQTPPMEAMPVLPGVEMPGMGHGMGTMDMTEDIEMLRSAEPFDASFIEVMVDHHRSAIEAAQVVLAQTQRDEIRNLAEDIISSQQAEIEQLEAWLAEWYPGGA